VYEATKKTTRDVDGKNNHKLSIRIIVMQGTRVSYSFRTNNTWVFFRLLALCLFEFLVLVIFFLWWLFQFWEDGGFSLLVGISLPIVLPVLTFYFFRKKSTEEIIVLISASEMEIHWPSKRMLISFADIESYSASSTGQETYDRESVRIRLKNGKKVRLTATSDICDIKPLAHFREKFDELAQNLKLQKKNTWEERLLSK